MPLYSPVIQNTLANNFLIWQISISLEKGPLCWKIQWMRSVGKRCNSKFLQIVFHSPSFCWWCCPHTAPGCSHSRRWWTTLTKNNQHKLRSKFSTKFTWSNIVKALDPFLPLWALTSYIYQFKFQFFGLMKRTNDSDAFRKRCNLHEYPTWKGTTTMPEVMDLALKTSSSVGR